MGLVFNIVAPATYLLIALTIANSGGEMKSQADPKVARFLPYILMLVSLFCFGLAYYIRKKSFLRPIINSEASFATDFNEQAFQRSIFIFATIEAVAIYGFILFFITGLIEYLYCFGGVSVVVFLLLRPNYSLLEESLAAQEIYVSKQQYFKKTFGILPF
ncbi:MAG: hypothetical protein GY865_16715 [candidate division Zixibacteria bacterium]|nr:hypothetical protein [candidate division Zixibacteria bacterium]